MVDHHTESLVNPTIWSRRKLRNDSVDLFWWLVWRFYSAGIRVAMSKADISKVYRRLPIMADNIRFAAIIFFLDGVIMVSRHHALSFGATSSCWGCHRAGGLMQRALRKVC